MQSQQMDLSSCSTSSAYRFECVEHPYINPNVRVNLKDMAEMPALRELDAIQEVDSNETFLEFCKSYCTALAPLCFYDYLETHPMKKPKAFKVAAASMKDLDICLMTGMYRLPATKIRKSKFADGGRFYRSAKMPYEEQIRKECEEFTEELEGLMLEFAERVNSRYWHGVDPKEAIRAWLHCFRNPHMNDVINHLRPDPPAKSEINHVDPNLAVDGKGPFHDHEGTVVNFLQTLISKDIPTSQKAVPQGLLDGFKFGLSRENEDVLAAEGIAALAEGQSTLRQSTATMSAIEKLVDYMKSMLSNVHEKMQSYTSVLDKLFSPGFLLRIILGLFAITWTWLKRPALFTLTSLFVLSDWAGQLVGMGYQTIGNLLAVTVAHCQLQARNSDSDDLNAQAQAFISLDNVQFLIPLLAAVGVGAFCQYDEKTMTPQVLAGFWKFFKKMHAVDIGLKAMEHMFSYFHKCCSAALEYFFGLRDKSVSHIVKLRKVDERIGKWAERVVELSGEYFQIRLSSDEELRQEVFHLKDEGMEFLTLIGSHECSTSLNPLILPIINKLNLLVREVEQTSPQSMKKVAPFSIYFVGPTRVGKSRVAQEMLDDICYDIGVPTTNRMYARGIEDRFWSRYKGEYCVLYDDIFQIAGTEHSTQQACELFNICSNNATPLNMADLSEKGRLFDSKVLWMTSNVAYPKINDVNSDVALWARRHVLVHMEFKPEFFISEGVYKWDKLVQADGLTPRPLDETVNFYLLPPTVPSQPNKSQPLTYTEVKAYIQQKLNEHLTKENHLQETRIARERLRKAPALSQEVEAALKTGTFIPAVKQCFNAVGQGPDLSPSTSKQEDPPVAPLFDIPKPPKAALRPIKILERLVQHDVVERNPPSESNVDLNEQPAPIQQVLRWNLFADKNTWKLMRVACKQNHEYCFDSPELCTMVQMMFGFERQELYSHMYASVNSLPPPAFIVQDSKIGTVSVIQRYIDARKKLEQGIMARMWSALKEHPLYVILGGLGLAAGLFGVYELFMNTNTTQPITKSDVVENVLEFIQKPNIQPEANISGDPRTAKQVRSKVPMATPPRIVGNAVAHGSIDPNAVDLVVNRVVPNLVRLNFENKASFVGFRFCGTCCLLPGHCIDMANLPSRVEVKSDDFSIMIYMEEKDIVRFGGGKDVAVWNMGIRMPAAKNSIKQFISEADVKDVEMTEAELVLVERTAAIKRSFMVEAKLVKEHTSDTSRMRAEYEFKNKVYCMADGFSYSIHSKPGDCGALLVAVNPRVKAKFLGVHVAGTVDQNQGWAELVTREMLMDAVEYLMREDPIAVLDVELPVKEPMKTEAIVAQALVLPEGRYTYYGIIPPIHNVMKTQIRKSALYDRVYEHLTEPSVLRPDDPRNMSGDSPFVSGLRKYGVPAIPYDPELFTRVNNAMRLETMRMKPYRPPKLLSLEEAINGSNKYPHFERINMQSSPGYPLVRTRPGNAEGKRYMFDFDVTEDSETARFKPEFEYLIEELKERILKAAVLVRGASAYTTYLKDERRPLEKIAKAKTRIFQGSNLITTLLTRIFYLDYIAAFYGSRIDTFHAVGIDVEGPEWTYLYRKHAKISTDNGFDGDFGTFDGKCVMPEMSQALAEDVNDWYHFYNPVETFEIQFPDGVLKLTREEAANVRLVIAHEWAHCSTIALNLVYSTHQGNPSGTAMCVVLNSNTNSRLMRLSWLELANEHAPNMATMAAFQEHVAETNYGDDNIITVSPEALFFNQKNVGDALAKHGLEYTAADKTEIDLDFKPLDQLTFLKRGFRSHPQYGAYKTAPISKTTIQEEINWIRDGPNNWTAMIENIRSSFRMAYAHGPEYYEEHSGKVNTALLQLPGGQPLLDSYLDFDREFLSKFY